MHDNPNEISVYLKENVIYDLDNLISLINYLYDDEYKINVYYYDFDINTFDTDELLYSDRIDTKPIIYISEEMKYESQLNFKIFKFKGNLIEAQDYSDNVFLSNNYSPLFTVESLKASYNSYYAIIYNNLMAEIIKFLLLIIAYCYANYFLIENDFISNHRKYYLSYCEGGVAYNLSSYLFKFSTPILIAFVICFFLNITLFKDLLINLLIMFIIELLFYIIFVFNKRKYGEIND